MPSERRSDGRGWQALAAVLGLLLVALAIGSLLRWIFFGGFEARPDPPAATEATEQPAPR